MQILLSFLFYKLNKKKKKKTQADKGDRAVIESGP